MDVYQVIREPHITEKGTFEKEKANQICFKVHRRTNKVEIKKAIETLFNVKVLDVRTMNVRGKRRTVGRNSGKRPDWKKAMVKLAPGEKIEFFEGI